MLALVLLVGVTSAAEPSPPRKAAVLTVHAEAGISQGVANLLAGLLTEDVARSGRYEVVSSAEVGVMLGVERQRALMSCAEESCLSEIGSALGADVMFDGSVGAIGNLRVLSLRVFDGKTGKVEARESATVDDEGKLTAALHELIAKLLGMPAAPKPRSKVPALAVLGGAAALAVGGGAVGVAALNQYNAYRDAPASPLRDAMHSGAQTLGAVADGLYGAAVVTAVVAVVMLVISGGPPSGSAP